MQNALRQYAIGQFGNPQGMVGRLAGHIMDKRPSNRQRNLWTLDLMQPTAGDRFLEIGYGPGFAIRHLLKRDDSLRITGIDRSKTMFRMARARNSAAVRSKRLTLVTGSIEALEPWTLGGPFSKAYSINTVMFWPDPVAVFRLLKSRMTEGGQVYVTYQPRVGERTDEAALAKAAEVQSLMRDAGYADSKVEICSNLSPVAVCVIGSV